MQPDVSHLANLVRRSDSGGIGLSTAEIVGIGVGIFVVFVLGFILVSRWLWHLKEKRNMKTHPTAYGLPPLNRNTNKSPDNGDVESQAAPPSYANN